MISNKRGPHHALLCNLTRELFQTEVSASRHCRREAERNPGSPPAEALLAVAKHADTALQELGELARAHDLPQSVGGGLLGEAFSELRERVADRILDGERSYRATLLGIRHGTDVVRMFGCSAALDHREELARWSETWLTQREPLVREVERQIEWFAVHVDRALARAH
jgi:hypothetical protein